jgi:hypothetical protein
MMMMKTKALLFLVLASCSADRGPATTATPTSTATTPATTAATGVVVKPDPVADAWKTAPSDQYVSAADCPGFMKVPTQIQKSVLVEAPCLEIPAGAKITIAQDQSLYIVATRKLRIGDGAKIVGRGVTGAPGAAAQTATKDWAPSGPDQSEKINCACRAVRCKPGWQQCSAGDDAELRGGRGGNGRRGADVYIVARELIVGSGVGIDVSGGLGGAAGSSGHVECRYGGMQCASAPATSEGDGEGGANGVITLRAALASALPMMIAIERIATPPSAVNKHVADTMGSFRTAVGEAHDKSATFETSAGVP